MFKEDQPVKQKKSGFKRFFLNTVIYFAIVAGLVLGLPKFLAWALKTPYPMAAITSGSMWPALKEGDLVFIKAVPPQELEIGDIIVYRNEIGFTIHRVSELKNELIVTKGDANFQKDKPIERSQIVGRTLAVFGKPLRIPYLGLITVMARKLN